MVDAVVADAVVDSGMCGTVVGSDDINKEGDGRGTDGTHERTNYYQQSIFCERVINKLTFGLRRINLSMTISS
jgi:hypothetical protein